jgi:hypothetical protein
MKNKIILPLLIFFTSFTYTQTVVIEDSNNVGYKKILRSYLTAGVGWTSDYVNYGAGLFFPIYENLLIGPRVNANFEIDELFKIPEEYMWDLDLSIRYIPFISERLVLSTGAGVGYSMAQKRGEFVKTNFPFVQEYEEIHTSSISVLAEIEGSILLTDNFGISLSGYTLFADDRTFIRYEIGLFLCKILEIK